MKALDRARSAILTLLMDSSRHDWRLDRMRDSVSGHLARDAPNGRRGQLRRDLKH